MIMTEYLEYKIALASLVNVVQHNDPIICQRRAWCTYVTTLWPLVTLPAHCWQLSQLQGLCSLRDVTSYHLGPSQYKDRLSRYGYFHYKDKTVVRPSYSRTRCVNSHWSRVMPYDVINIGSIPPFGLVLWSNKSSPKPVLTDHQWGSVVSAILLETCTVSMTKMSLNITHLKLQPCLLRTYE